jgi:hypothetical protein
MQRIAADLETASYIVALKEFLRRLVPAAGYFRYPAWAATMPYSEPPAHIRPLGDELINPDVSTRSHRRL